MKNIFYFKPLWSKFKMCRYSKLPLTWKTCTLFRSNAILNKRPNIRNLTPARWRQPSGQLQTSTKKLDLVTSKISKLKIIPKGNRDYVVLVTLYGT